MAESGRPAQDRSAWATVSAFVVNRVVGPLGVILQMALASRLLPGDGLAQYVQIYAAAVVLSGVSDLGQRHLLFATIDSTSSLAKTSDAFAGAMAMKALGSSVIIIGSALAVHAGMAPPSVLLSGLLAVSLPAGDPSAVLHRTRGMALHEARLLAFEQLMIVGALAALLALRGSSGVASVCACVASVGCVRLAVSRRLARRLLTARRARTRRMPPARVTVFATLSILVSQSFVRLPLVTAMDLFDGESYAVFAAVYLALHRIEMLGTAVLQAAKSVRGGLGDILLGTTSGPLLLGGSLAVVIVAPLSIGMVRELTVMLFLGSGRATSGSFAAAVVAGGMVVGATVRLRLQIEGRAGIVLVATAVGVLPQAIYLSIDLGAPEAAYYSLVVSILLYVAVLSTGLRHTLTRGQTQA